MKEDLSVKIALKHAGLTTLGLILYFLIMKAAGLLQVLELRALNILILLAGVWTAAQAYKKGIGDDPPYFEGFWLCFRTSVLSVLTFAVFVLFWLLLDEDFMEYIQESGMFGEHLTPFTAAITIAIEGIASGIVISLAVMQYFKKRFKG